ncbi:hypothetical protein NLJ89_g11483 [Agrocybe chaxingu]|uniref:Uncharacterized protein n=1 Tax=Agrocybe chaxingu TaxID=84603 RepID=A0A9W8JWP7_9AGAR|nr:hypothetical protein NLJ89_g11483 [Agrocybe chaxingu]
MPSNCEDKFGIPRDGQGLIAFDGSSWDPDTTTAADSLVIAEVKTWSYPIRFIADPSAEDPSLRAQDTFVSSPNMDFVPDFGKDGDTVYMRQNGCFYTHDFSLFPQWQYDSTFYLPFVCKRPSPEDLPNHPLHVIWHDLQESDFELEQGSITKVGHARADLVAEFMRLRKELYDKAQRSMQLSSVLLMFAVHNFFMILLAVTSFQRHYLECLALYEYYTIWFPGTLEPYKANRPVDTTIIGVLTAHLAMAQHYLQLGVPVAIVWPTLEPYSGLVVKRHPEMEFCFKSRPSPLRNLISHSLKIGGIELGHVTHVYYPSDPNQPGGLTSSYPQQASTSHSSLHISASLSISQPPSTSTSRSINKEKFADIKSQFVKSAMPSWLCDHPNSDLFRGYVLPDPFIFMNPAASEKHVWAFACVWLMIRSGWMVHVTAACTGQQRRAMLSPQHWKDYLMKLAVKMNLLEATKSGQQFKRRRTDADLDSIDEIFDLPVEDMNEPQDVYWRGELMRKAYELKASKLQFWTRAMEGVMWDLCEHNWRLELLALNQCVIPRRDAEHAEIRDGQWMKGWGKDTTTHGHPIWRPSAVCSRIGQVCQQD